MNNTIAVRCLVLLTVAVISIAVGFFRHRNIQFGDPISIGTACLFFILYLLWEWNTNKVEFIKRCVFAALFAAVPAIVAGIIGLNIVISVYIGFGTFLFLAVKTSHWKQHFLVTLTVSLVFIFLLALARHEWSDYESNIYKEFIVFGLTLLFGFFYITYLYVVNSPKLKTTHPIAVKLARFTGLSFLGCMLVIINHIVSTHYHISFVVSFGISVLIALGFWWSYRLLDKKNTDYSEELKTKEHDICDCCGKTGISQELLFKINSGKRVCANCLKKMN